MSPSVLDAISALIRTDPTVSPKDRPAILMAVKNHGVTGPAPDATPAPELVTRKKAAELLCRTTRAVDLLAAQGHLTKVKLPGRIRACGFRRDQINALLEGRA